MTSIGNCLLTSKAPMALTDPVEPDPSLPPPPLPPAAEECCGRGCDPCIHDYYEAELEKWRQAHNKIR